MEMTLVDLHLGHSMVISSLLLLKSDDNVRIVFHRLDCFELAAMPRMRYPAKCIVAPANTFVGWTMMVSC
jgi:hypothetical protein